LISRLEERRARLDPTFKGYSDEEARQLSIHSQLLVALAEGGILGGAFFLGMGALLFKTMRSLVRYSAPCRAFLLYLVIAGCWNLLMSPFSGVARVEISLAICACLLMILQRQGELAEDYRE
jgi:O-antigen ligase